MNKAKFLLLGLHSLAEETKLVMENFSKMLHAIVEVCGRTLRPFQMVNQPRTLGEKRLQY